MAKQLLIRMGAPPPSPRIDPYTNLNLVPGNGCLEECKEPDQTFTKPELKGKVRINLSFKD